MRLVERIEPSIYPGNTVGASGVRCIKPQLVGTLHRGAEREAEYRKDGRRAAEWLKDTNNSPQSPSGVVLQSRNAMSSQFYGRLVWLSDQ
jgi:hypothetical protein